jgi:regulatory protein YycI of two-component signal transduction system YycFG
MKTIFIVLFCLVALAMAYIYLDNNFERIVYTQENFYRR